MARILPDDWQRQAQAGTRARVLDTLHRFEHGLPDRFTVFHGVHWSRPDTGIAQLADVDFVILAPDGRLLLIEQKAGLLEEAGEGLSKRRHGQQVRISVHVGQILADLRRRLEPLARGETPGIDYLLYCPDYQVREPTTAGLPPGHVVDAGSRDRLCAAVIALFPDAAPRPALAQRLHRFFANELDLVPDAGALIGRAQELYVRLADGLAVWARRFEIEPPRLRVTATAGSGKTQLALALLGQARERGERALYVCFNRPLADHMSALLEPAREAGGAQDDARAAAPEPADPRQASLPLAPRTREPAVQLVTYHQWCSQRLRAAGEPVDFAQADVYRRMAERSQALPVRASEHVDCLIVDEGQDFEQAWFEDLLRAAGPHTRVWWLEDPMQNLYQREPVQLSGWARLHTETNYRSPHAVVAMINTLMRPSPPILAAGPVPGRAPDVLVYDDEGGMLARTKAAVAMALREGFRREDIALITLSGRARSVLLHQERLGPHRLRRFTGRYDAAGRPEYARGDLLVDSVYRFKGQSAACVILSEVAFDEWDEQARRKLFVGMTRAALHLIIVAHRDTADRLVGPAA